MKTDTKQKLIKFIEKRGPTRPTDLAKHLDITPQALHRHLKSLVSMGTLVSQGSMPYTRYALAGIPDFSDAFKWIDAQTIKKNPTDKVCETRDVFAARLSHLKDLIRQGFDLKKLSLLISSVGEIGNNSFDHNLGQWRDVPGCWFEMQVTGNRVWICIGDRGQGIYNSLIRVDPKITNEQSAMEVAFEQFISGRAPEKRGNGLKYVKDNILREQERGLSCFSGKGHMQYGDWGLDCEKILKSHVSKVKGTLTLMAWRLG